MAWPIPLSHRRLSICAFASLYLHGPKASAAWEHYEQAKQTLHTIANTLPTIDGQLLRTRPGAVPRITTPHPARWAVLADIDTESLPRLLECGGTDPITLIANGFERLTLNTEPIAAAYIADISDQAEQRRRHLDRLERERQSGMDAAETNRYLAKVYPELAALSERAQAQREASQ
jgi:hypothetical protein